MAAMANVMIVGLHKEQSIQSTIWYFGGSYYCTELYFILRTLLVLSIKLPSLLFILTQLSFLFYLVLSEYTFGSLAFWVFVFLRSVHGPPFQKLYILDSMIKKYIYKLRSPGEKTLMRYNGRGAPYFAFTTFRTTSSCGRLVYCLPKCTSMNR